MILMDISKIVKLIEAKVARGRREREVKSCCSMGLKFQWCKVSTFWRSAVVLIVNAVLCA